MKKHNQILAAVLCCGMVLSAAACGGEGSSTAGENTAPEISGVFDQAVEAGSVFDALAGVTASDKEDGDVSGKIVITSMPDLSFQNGKVTISDPGNYELTYSVTDKGGMETKATITAHPTDFCYVGIFSGGTVSVEESKAMKGFRENNKLIFINYGSYEVANPREGRPDPAKLTQELKESGMNAHYLVTPESGHEWKTWRLALYTFSQLLFK